MAQLFANAARSTLTASITNTSTQLQINPADQALFPVATGADWFKVALEDSNGNLEFMKVQRAVGQSLLTITERATEDATKFPARAFVAGSLVELRMTAADLAVSIAHPSLATGAHAASAISVTPAGAIASTTVQAALQELDAEKAVAADVTLALNGKVGLTGAETIAGVKTFASSPVLPGNAVSALEAVPKQQLDGAVSTINTALGQRMQYSLTASQPTTSGTAIDFTSIPSWAKRITVQLAGVSTAGSGYVGVRLGTGLIPTYVTSGYLGCAWQGPNFTNFTDLMAVSSQGLNIDIRHGTLVLTRVTGNTWVSSSVVAVSNAASVGGGAFTVALGDVLTAVRLTTHNGDTFDAGSVSILIEG